ncbi:MAG: hypothetical protein K6E70_02805 [Butyrivibrio sp.]|nr:hypothetical protein [Butyrivibrio sp.]
MKKINSRIALTLVLFLIVANTKITGVSAVSERSEIITADFQVIGEDAGADMEESGGNAENEEPSDEGGEAETPDKKAASAPLSVEDTSSQDKITFYYDGEELVPDNGKMIIRKGKEFYVSIESTKGTKVEPQRTEEQTNDNTHKYVFDLAQGNHNITIILSEKKITIGENGDLNEEIVEYPYYYSVVCQDDTKIPDISVSSDLFKGNNIVASKDGKSYLIDGAFCLSANVKDTQKMKGLNVVDETEYASGVKEVKLFASKLTQDGKQESYDQVITGDNGQYDFNFPSDGEYYIDRIEAWDNKNPGSSVFDIKKTIYVENLSEQKTNYTLSAGAWSFYRQDGDENNDDYQGAWYSYNKYNDGTLVVTVKFHTYGKVDPDYSLSCGWDVVEPATKAPDTISNVKNEYVLTYKFDATKDQDKLYTFSYYRFDEWDKKKIDIPIRIDNTAPKGTFKANFFGNTDKYFVDITNVEKETNGENTNYTYSITAAQGQVVTKDDKFAVNVTSADAEDSGSGIVKMLCKYSVDGAEIPEPMEGEVNKDGTVKAGKAIVFEESKYSEHTFVITSVVLEDRAGNTYDLLPDTKNDDVSYEIDSLSPRIDEAYLGDAVFMDPDGTMYFKNAFSNQIGITDKNFDNAEVRAVGDGLKPSFSKKKGSGGETNVYKLEFKDDGRYEYYIEATDKVKNITPADDKEKSASTRKVVIDSSKPEIDIKYVSSSGKVSADADTENYTNSDVSVVVTVKEANIADNGISVEISGEDLKGGDKSHHLSLSDFETDGEKYVATYNITEEGKYSVTATATDKCGYNATADAGKFIIDKTEPKVTVSFDNNEAVNEHYYKAARVATIKVEDLSFDEGSVELNIDALGNAPSLSGWSGSEGEHTATLDFSQDGKYKFSFSCADKAGNLSDTFESEEFIIDRTEPKIKIDFDNNAAENEFYYNKARTATIDIEDISFDDKAVQVKPIEGEECDALPEVGAFSGGDTNHKANISFAADGKYGFEVTCKDLAGNESEKVSTKTFIIDTTMPEVTITGVEDKSANNGEVAPVITYMDKNVDTNNSGVTAVGKNNGVISASASLTKVDDGYRTQIADFPHEKKYDDVYVITAKVRDLAGNETNDEIMFSVNRFGSVYYIDDNTEKVIENYYTNEAPEISITEVNIDELEWKNVSVGRDGDVKELRSGKDYTVSETENEKSWNSFTYTLKPANFEKDGNYSVVISSKDKATNEQDNVVKDKEIEFAVDGTEPGIAVSGLEDNGIYEEESHPVSFNVTDNMGVTGATVYENDKVLAEYSEEQLKNDGFTEQIVLDALDKSRNIRIVSTDVAGNESAMKFDNVIVSLNATAVKSSEEEAEVIGANRDQDGEDKEAIPRNKHIPVVPVAGGSTAAVVGGYALFEFLKKKKIFK